MFLLQVWVAGLSRVDVTNMLMEVMEVTGVPLTSINHERQSAALLWTPDTGGSCLSQIFWEHENLSSLSIIWLIQLL